MWSRCSSAAKDVQALEAKCLLSGTPLSESSVEQPALTSGDANFLAPMSEAGFIQINTVGLQDLSGLSLSQQSQFLYGPQLPGTTSPILSEDLYDEGAGAVWGSLSDEGGPSSYMLDGTGAVDIGVDGIMGTDDIGEEYNATGGAVWGTIADEGVYGADGWDDVPDYGTGGYGDIGVDDVADYGAGDTGVTGTLADNGADYGAGDYGPGDTGYDATGALDSGFDDMGGIFGDGDTGPGDYGPGDAGVSDIPIPDTGDFPGDTGPGDTGPGDADGSDGPTVGIEVPDSEAWEGPYRVSKLDEAKFVLNVTGANPNSAVDVNVKFTGTAKVGTDYEVKDSLGNPVLLMMGIHDEFSTASFHVAAGAGGTWFKIYAVMDGDYDPHETVIVTIVADPDYQIGNTATATAVIEDLTGDLDITSVENEFFLLDEDEEDDPGADLILDDDHDAKQDAPDMVFYALEEHGFDANEDDVLDLRIESHVQGTNDAAIQAAVESFSVDYDPLLIHVWQQGFTAAGIWGWIPLPDDELVSIARNATRNLKVEGVGAGAGTMTLVWHANDPCNWDYVFDTLKYTVWQVDLDINSDNSGGPLQPPSHNAWEEFIESHDHALGTLMYPREYYLATNFPSTANQFQEVSIVASTSHRKGSEIGMTIEISGDSGSGDLQIWSVPSNWPGGLKPWSLETGGHMITPGRMYTVTELSLAVNENRATPRTIWLEGSNAATSLDTYNNIRYAGRPDDAIKATVYAKRGEAWNELRADSVKYLVVNYNTFYPHLQWNIDPLPGVTLPTEFEPGHDRQAEVLRDSMAAGIVYGGAGDGKNVGLLELGRDDLLHLGISDSIIDRILNSNVPGFNAAVYLDLASAGGQLILSFAGTDDGWDAIEDVAQGVGLGGIQYPEAIDIGAAIARADGVRSRGLRITGHSLGGGLASVAYLAARAVDNNSTTGTLSYLHCNTFNAAGVHPASLWKPVNNALVPRIPGIVEAYDAEITEMKIDAWYLSYDILSFVQDNTVAMFQALGNRHKMAGPRISAIDAQLIRNLRRHLAENFHGDSLASLLTLLHQTDLATAQNFWQVSDILLNSHKTRFYYYGLMVIPKSFDDNDIDGLWDIYGGRES
ncbi:MAG: hypothetical protein WKF77_29055, partial [Planctomycetaceae bacterium]